MSSSQEQDAQFANFMAYMNENIDSDVKFLTSMAPHAAVKEVDETIQSFKNWEPEIGYSHVVSLILNYTEKLRVALDNLPSDGDHTLINYVISESSSAHENAKFDY